MFKKLVLSLILALSLVATTSSQTQFDTTQLKSAFAFEQITVTGSSTTFTSATYNPTPASGQSRADSRAELATMNCDDNSSATIRARWDGTAPTASVGVIIFAGQSVTIYGYTHISNFKAIRTSSTSVVCNIHYYRRSANTF